LDAAKINVDVVLRVRQIGEAEGFLKPINLLEQQLHGVWTPPTLLVFGVDRSGDGGNNIIYIFSIRAWCFFLIPNVDRVFRFSIGFFFISKKIQSKKKKNNRRASSARGLRLLHKPKRRRKKY